MEDVSRAGDHTPTARSVASHIADHPRRVTARPPRNRVIRLAVEGLVDNHQSPPHLPCRAAYRTNLPDTRTTRAALSAIAAAGPLPAIQLDPITAVDNPAFYDTLAHETNLPADLQHGLMAYRRG